MVLMRKSFLNKRQQLLFFVAVLELRRCQQKGEGWRAAVLA